MCNKIKKKIALIFGGDSSEYEISIKSAKFVSENIDRERFDVYEILQKGSSWSFQNHDSTHIEVDKSDFSISIDDCKIKFDIAYIVIHGTPGENGLLQAYFEMMNIPFNTCSSFVSAITFDKYACKSYLQRVSVLLAKEIFVQKGESWSAQDIIDELGLPLFVKPSGGGSSFGITKVKKIEDIDIAIELAFKEGERVLIEEFIDGREITNGVYMDGGELIALPVTEIISDNEFFDYEAKYLGKSKEICPAEISNQLTIQIQEISKDIYRFLGCKGLVRMDYILAGDQTKDETKNFGIYFLEMNVVPGMTKESLIPQQVRVAGMAYSDFFNILIDNIR